MLDNQDDDFAPLAEKQRPVVLSDMVGQTHLLAKGQVLWRLYHDKKIHSMILWGPPGTGKTTLARLLSSRTQAYWISISAVMSGIKEIRQAIEQAKLNRQSQKKTVLFVDEVHRFNKAQQDAFLPHIEDGTIIFIGATTENPSFELNNALLSRTKVFVLKSLSEDDMVSLLTRVCQNHYSDFEIQDEVISIITKSSNGDARLALNTLESSVQLSENNCISKDILTKIMGEKMAFYDKGGDLFYEQISAFHKSVRGSDPDAALYWMMRMLSGGCDPFYIARRLVRIASEDIGNADTRALEISINAWDAYHRLGDAEGELALAHAVIYLSSVPKSNAVYNAYKKAKQAAIEFSSLDVPIHLRNASTKLQKHLAYGKEYHYSHNGEDGFSENQRYFPCGMDEQIFYQPSNYGLESKIAQRLDYLRAKKKG